MVELGLTDTLEISGGYPVADVVFIPGDDSIEVIILDSKGIFNFNDFTFVPNGCFYKGDLVHPLKIYSGYRVVTQENWRFKLIPEREQLV